MTLSEPRRRPPKRHRRPIGRSARKPRPTRSKRRSPIAAFGEFCKIIFVKHRDEKNLDRPDGKPYEFQRRDGESSEDLAARIHKLYLAEQEQEPDVFTDQINVDPGVLAQCVEHLEGISLDRTELDTKGVAFEEFMGGFFKGDFGQYFTPRELIAFAVEVINPDRRQTVLDPACGSGGFLLYALDHVRREADRVQKVGTSAHWKYWHEFAERKASIVFMRRLGKDEKVATDAPIFMALAENIGYDATGRKTFTVEVESEVAEREKVEIQRSDLFDYRVTYEWSTTNPKRPGWSERHREIIPDTGLVAQWRAFQKDAKPFFV